MIPTKRQYQLSFLGMSANGLPHRLTNGTNQSRSEEFPGWRVIRKGDVLELMVSVKFHFPSKTGDLVCEARFDKLDGPAVDACAGLAAAKRAANDLQRFNKQTQFF